MAKKAPNRPTTGKAPEGGLCFFLICPGGLVGWSPKTRGPHRKRVAEVFCLYRAITSDRKTGYGKPWKSRKSNQKWPNAGGD
ncbi:adenosine deaminase/DNA-3-methyladenine glycosylase/8-oxoguanine DNA glycosylase [Anopheles sinensis]|uniref:Adenosine deaminase/DNA-3-methyladenine glycosylase/8-oxoguanine DNA glycosylase n=1 Tax=Anopheles sinensis TaxID=74873 RepID=A0A084WG88_ANOSI|nr:adenosine deaminase/DNA-3-methyladenine glycosylase/8-oxoguanine DNA glycosylase [Anopheles sinensis]